MEDDRDFYFWIGSTIAYDFVDDYPIVCEPFPRITF